MSRTSLATCGGLADLGLDQDVGLNHAVPPSLGAPCYAASGSSPARRRQADAVRRRGGRGDDRVDGRAEEALEAHATIPLAAYRRIRKPMPPPEKVVRDKRRELDEEEARREIEEER